MDNFNNITEQNPPDQSSQNASAPLQGADSGVQMGPQLNTAVDSPPSSVDNTQNSAPPADAPPTASAPLPDYYPAPQSFQSAPIGVSSFDDLAQKTPSQTSASSPVNNQEPVAPIPAPVADSTPMPIAYSQPAQTHTSTTVEVPNKPSLFQNLKDGIPATPLILALLFFMVIQNLGSKCKNLCKIDTSMQNSIFSGAALGFILTVCMPLFMQHTTDAVLHLSDLYLKNLSHSLLSTFFAFGIGVVLNHTFEKSASHSLMQDVVPSRLMYGINTFVLCLLSFCFASFLSLMHKGTFFVFMQYVFFFSGVVYIENAIMGNLYMGQNLMIRRVLLCVFACLGLFGQTFLPPLYGLLSYGFLTGFMFYSVLKIEMTAAKRNANYIAFIISFFALAGMNLICSLHDSIRC
ncbi:MAG: hypothetical protein CNLJKLNK_00680 [Holosporales bacterium]